MRFCTRTKGLSEKENREFAKNLKDFTKNEMKKFREGSQESEESSEEE